MRVLSNKKLFFSVYFFLFALVCTSANALPATFFDLPWEEVDIDGSASNPAIKVAQMDNDQPGFATRRVCKNDRNDFQYGIIMLHGTVNSEQAGRGQIVDATKFNGNMSTMMDKFAYDCALVYIPGAKTGDWDYKNNPYKNGQGFGVDDDLIRVGRLVKYMHDNHRSPNGQKLKIFLIGGSSGAIMSFDIAHYKVIQQDQGYLAGLSGVMLADGISTRQSTGTLVNGIPQLVTPTPNDGQVTDTGLLPWNIKTFIVSSDIDYTILRVHKNVFANALLRKGAGFVKVRVPESEGGCNASGTQCPPSHAPWTQGANNDIYAEIQLILNN